MNKSTMQRATYSILITTILVALLKLAIFGVIVYVIYHFISKFW